MASGRAIEHELAELARRVAATNDLMALEEG